MAPRATDGGRVKAQLAKVRATLETAGIPLAWLDAEILLAHVLQSSRERLHSHPERELTVELAIEWLKARPQARRMIDLGTGSGAVAISVAKGVPQIRIEARDVSARALRVAADNVAHYRLR